MKTTKQKCFKMYLCPFIVLTVSLTLLSGCGARNNIPESIPSSVPVSATSNTGDSSFSYSEGIDENGFWEGIKAVDFIQMFDYNALVVPNEVHYVPDETIQYEIDAMLASYSSNEPIFDREVEYGDNVNIDYVGSVDGVEFDGGSTGGAGTYVTAGSTDYIDDFLDQIIGHMPGETIDVKVKFPDDYQQEDLQGKAALFVTTINYIAGDAIPVELTNDFVMENLFDYYGWATVDEMKSSMRVDIQKYSVQEYINDYFSTEVTIRSVPDQLTKYQERAMIKYFMEGAQYYGMELEEFLMTYENVSSIEELIESSQEKNLSRAKGSLVAQAIAESAGFSISNENLASYFEEFTGSNDYSTFEEEYGLPYLKQAVLYQKVLDHVLENAVLE